MEIIDRTSFDDGSFDLHLQINEYEMYKLEKLYPGARITSSLYGGGYYHVMVEAPLQERK